MADHVAQAFKDFAEFLSGTRAPALVGQSLATVVLQEQPAVAAAVVRWAYAHPQPEQFGALIAARNKVFDIFFYRVVRFRRIYEFFDGFEEALVGAVTPLDAIRLKEFMAESPWREIRPLGSFRDPLEFALEKRRHAAVERERFNDDLYRNATHQILSADKRHTFDDERTASLVSLYQSQLAGVFDDFVDLIKDPQQRREILLANTADRHAIYATKSRFDIENYIAQLMEFVIALINDDFFEHGMQVFSVVRQIQKDFGLDLQGLYRQRFKAQCDLIDKQRLAEYSASPARAILLRTLLPLFEPWTQGSLFNAMLVEQDRKPRKLAVALLGAYGHEAYESVVQQLVACNAQTPWYYVRNLAYLLSRIVTGHEALKHRAVAGLAPHLYVGNLRPVNLQVVAALGFIGTPDAVALLVGKLEQFGAHAADPDAKEVCSKIVSTLFGVGTERAVDAAGTFCVARNLVSVHRDDFARAVLPPSLRERIAARIRSETRTLRITKSLIGNASGAKALLSAVGHSGYPEIDAVCHEMTAAFPARHQLAAESARILATPAPPPLIASDRLLHAHLAKGDLPQALCHAYDAGSCGRIEVTTREGVECWIDVALGQVVSAGVSDSLVENERALHWIALLEGKDVRTITFRQAERPADAASVATPTSELLRDLLFQRAEVRHIVDGIISPESRFQRRDVHPIYTDFSRLDQPDRYAMVWRLLAEEVDMRGLRSASGLSRHDIFRVLLYFHRRNMISVDGARRDAGVARVSDAIATMEVYLQRIERRPLQLRFYHMAAEACAFLERQVVTDDALSTAASALGTYLLEAYNAHRAFSEENLDICKRTLTLIAQYHRGRNAGDRQDLVDYVGFTFAAVSAPSRPMGEESRSLLEQLENIAYTNDPFDLSDHERDSHGVDILVETVRAALAAAGVTVEALAEGEQPTSSEARIIVELFGSVATAYTKPIKDFVREITRARTTSEPVASAWLRVVEPSVNLLAGISAAMHFRKLDAIVGGLARAFADEKSRGEREIAPAFGEYVLARHDRLAELCPLAFGLYLSDEQLAVKRSELLATFVLRQLEGVTDEVVDRLAAANMTTVESYLDMVPEDIVVAAGIDAKLGDTIFMKFYQYRDLFEFDGDPAANPKYAAMFEIGLTTLKEICVELEKIGRAEQAGRETDAAGKERLLASRQRALASLLALLCMRGQYDRIEQIQVAPFEKRVLLLDQYFAELAGDAAPSGPNPSRMTPRADAAA